MKKHTDFLRNVIVLVALLFMTASAAAQSINVPATFSESEDAPVPKLKAGNIPMQKRVGDVNLDGLVSIADVTNLIDQLLSRTPGTNSDVNEDGNVSISDVTVLIDMLLSGSANYDTQQAQNALNDIYFSMRTAGWSTTGNFHQCFGISAYNLMAEVMGDDFIMGDAGRGWYWYDAAYNVKGRYTSSSWRSYDVWYAYYTWIADANYILKACQSITATLPGANYVKGQAYAIRAYSYFMLAQTFARTYKGHENDPGVPIFNGTVFNSSTGQARASVAQVYEQIDADIAQAVSLLNGTTQQDPVHIGYAVALGLQSRIALVEEDWQTALTAATDAISASGKTIQEVPDFMGLNDVNAGNVMWGAHIPADEVGMYASFFAHMSTDATYGQTAPKQISTWLYDKMNTTDARRAWWDPEDETYSTGGYIQRKFDFSRVSTWEGDYIWMRVEEMYLTAAEAACRLDRTAPAKGNLNALMAKRDPNYSCNKTGTSLGALTTDETGSLLEEILIQRRLELWGEDGRIYTIRRLRQGFERTSESGWPATLLLSSRSLQDPESYPWVLTIPLTEFLNNPNMSINYDQNPLGDYPDGGSESTGPQNISFTQAEYFETTVGPTYSGSIRLTRSTTQGNYICLVNVSDVNGISLQSYIAIFNDGSNTAYVSIRGSQLELGGTYSCVLTLSPYDIENGTSSGRITSARVEVKCQNGDPTGQHISFESESPEFIVPYSYTSVYVTLTRRVANGDYRATISMEDASDEAVRLVDDYVVFKNGELTAQAEIYVHEISMSGIYSCVLKLSDADIASAIPGEPQITQTTVTIKGKNVGGEGWIDAGTCTFTDYTWEDGYSATNVPIMNDLGTNHYAIISPLAHVYTSSYEEGQGDSSNFEFYLNNDGSISIDEGTSINYWGYLAYYNTSNYAQYCYVNQDGNTYDVHFLLKAVDGGNLYSGGRFVFTWNR